MASWIRCVCCLSFFMIALTLNAADASSILYAPPNDWVKPQFFAPPQPAVGSGDSSADDHLLLQERQINALEDETFFHTDRQILSVDGVQNGSTIKISFNPNYESLTWHWARIWRGGQILDRLDTNKIQIVQQEQDLDAYMLNGEKSAILVLDDVRVGDIIDCAYSLQGKNPVFTGHFSCAIPVEMEKPADRLLTRVVWPRQKPLYAMQHGCSVKPTMVIGKDAIDYTWDFRQASGFTLEDSLPDWYDPQQWVQLSDFHTWSEVNRWALDLFQVTPPFSPELSRKIAEWRQIPGQEQQVLAVLRFVQDDVRYFGIEIGPGTEKPTDPSTVFTRRFGDCKDKSLLFVTILRALGIEAYPVLVNADLGRGIDSWLPSAAAFDHCIAEVQCAGQIYYLDPTINYQRGPLAAHYHPNYARGLIISPYTTGLVTIPQNTGMPQMTTTEYFQIGHLGEASQLKVITVAQGRDADILRTLFATTKLNDIQSADEHLYSAFYPGLKTSSPIVVNDNEQQDIFQTTEYYSIDKIWTQPGQGVRYECDFFPVRLNGLLKKPVDTDRTQPLGTGYPEHQILRTEVTFPEDVVPVSEGKTIEDPAFTFHKSRNCFSNRAIIQYEYTALADSVSPDDMSDYLDHLNQCSQMLGNSLQWR
jgi:transglutaminase-like putative cysteine protease